jgi:hypothetical protein
MFNQIEYIKNKINDLENGYISKEEYRKELPYCIQIQQDKALFYNREYEVITNEDNETKKRNTLKDEHYYKNSDNFNFHFKVETNNCSYHLYQGDYSTLLQRKNICKYIEKVRLLIQFIENNEVLPENDKAFYIQ